MIRPPRVRLVDLSRRIPPAEAVRLRELALREELRRETFRISAARPMTALPAVAVGGVGA